jgi:hypothetical protein
MCTAVLIVREPATPPPHLGPYTRALLVSQDRRHLFVTPARYRASVTRSSPRKSRLCYKENLCALFYYTKDSAYSRSMRSDIWQVIIVHRTNFCELWWLHGMKKKLFNIWAKTIKHAFNSLIILGQLPINNKVKKGKNIALLYL